MNNRIVKIGSLKTGENNNICDVTGVLVGHTTINTKENKTGVTAILPHNRNLFKEKVVCSSYVFNGYGKSIGLVQIEELGLIETPILLTNTLSIGKTADSLISYMLKDNFVNSINPIVLECNDGSINNIQKRIIDENHIFNAINNANIEFEQGNVGTGTGMKCHGFKGGIGSSSRIIEINNSKYTIGVLVNSNFGSSNGEDLIFKGRKLGPLIKNYNLKKEEDKGSIIVVIATDAPLDSRQLKRLAKRAELGIARTGSYAGNGSGDIMIAFTTKNLVKNDSNNVESLKTCFSDNYLNPLFKACVDATEEAVLNSMLYAKGIESYNGIYYKSLLEYKELFNDLLIKNNQ